MQNKATPQFEVKVILINHYTIPQANHQVINNEIEDEKQNFSLNIVIGYPL